MGQFQDIFVNGLSSNVVQKEMDKRNFTTLQDVFKEAANVQRAIEKSNFKGSCNNCGMFNHKKRDCILSEFNCTFCSLVGHNEKMCRRRRRKDRRKVSKLVKRGQLMWF